MSIDELDSFPNKRLKCFDNNLSKGVWVVNDDFMYKIYDKTSNESLYAFDFDGCIIVPKDPKKSMSISLTDWKLFNDSPFTPSPIPAVLKRLHLEGKTLAFISNQNGVAKGKVSVEELQIKFDKVIDLIGVPVNVVCAIGNKYGLYRYIFVIIINYCEKLKYIYSLFTQICTFHSIRKPRIGSWKFLVDNCCPNCNVSESLFVGDAAGRPERAGRKKDFSDTDFKFALNVGVAFRTPEAFFLGSKDDYHCKISTSNMFSIASIRSSTPNTYDPSLFTEQDSPEIVVLVAPAASGKSTMAKKFINHYRINQDELKTSQKCIDKAFEVINRENTSVDDSGASITNKRSLVIDNTNITLAARKLWIDFAQKHEIPIRAVYISVSKDICNHLRVFRMLHNQTEKADLRYIEDIVINSMFKNLVVPHKSEGFDRVDAVEFIPHEFDDPATKNLFEQYLF